MSALSLLQAPPLLTAFIQQTPEAPLAVAGIELNDWFTAAAIVGSGLFVSVLLRRALISILRRGTTIETMTERLVGRLAQVIVTMLALSYALHVLGIRIGPLVGALGIGGVAIALALQDTLKNLFAGVILHAQRPFSVGDEIITGDMQGAVIDITSRAVTIRANSGRTLYVPNALLLDREIINLVRHGKRRSTLSVSVAYDTDLRQAAEVIRCAAAAADGVLADPPVQVLGAVFAESSVDFDIDFWHSPPELTRREVSSSVIFDVHNALRDANISIPFPQLTLWTGEAAAPETATSATRVEI